MKCHLCEDPIGKFDETITRVDKDGVKRRYHKGCYGILLDKIVEKVRDNERFTIKDIY